MSNSPFHSSQSDPQDDRVNLDNCEREPIHILGTVQSFGCLIAVSPDWMVTHASENCREHLGVEAQDIIGTRLSDTLSAETIHQIRGKMQFLNRGASAARMFGMDLRKDGRVFDASIHITGREFIFEFEPKEAEDERMDLTTVQPMVTRVRRHEDVESVCQEAARSLKILSGFDRVMVYKFAPDHSGQVIAEARNPGMEPFLRLRYPASDIPKQARELYKRSLLRLIADVNSPVSPIIPERSPEGEPLDLSLAVTRAVSPMHIEYLRNMGVHASMSVSILRDGELWGLFACHHDSPRHIDYEKRSAIELFAQLFSYELAEKENRKLRDDIEKGRVLHDKLMARMTTGGDLFESFEVMRNEIGEVISFDGIALYSGGRYAKLGSTPTEEEFVGLARFLNTSRTSTVFSTDHLVSVYDKAEEFADRAAGLMALPISRTPRDYIVLFRREITQMVKWAGNPDKPVEVGPNGSRLTPRKSFEAWKQIVRHKSAAWEPHELRSAEALRVTLLEVVLKVTDEASSIRQKAHEKQELLIAELNHRVRNILNLIRGLMSQSRNDVSTIEDFTVVLDGRIQALARAHDQLTAKEWTHSPLKGLIEVEVAAYLNQGMSRVNISGNDVLVSPAAFTTLALVMHELVTNSAKYGALSNADGQVDITIDHASTGQLNIAWRERNGPPVRSPTRQGFGTTIIERSIPFELSGLAEVRYRVTGLEADFMIPAGHVTAMAASETSQTAQTEGPAGSGEPLRLNGKVLLVEDNMIIAMDTTDMLLSMGAEDVANASSVAEAEALLKTIDFSFAVLDVNLGTETSLPLAKTLTDKGVPFLLATGYSGSSEIEGAFPKVPILKKPYTADTLEATIAELDLD